MKFEQLAAAVIHDVKNQLQSLMDEEQLALEQLPEQYRSIIEPILQRTSRLKNDALQLVILFRLGQNRPFPMDDAWPRDTANDIIEAAAIQFPSVKLVNDIDEDCQGFYNENLIHLALMTLITNSAQAGATSITLKAEEIDQGSGRLCIQVIDNGPGFSSTMLETQGESADENSSHDDGTGLGLYFVKLIVEHHKALTQGASVVLTNNAKKGACVTLNLA
jgi:signal transduction histidine kinase